MMTCLVLLILLWSPSAFLPSTAPAGEPAAGAIDETAALVEANRLLEEELKLAARPRIYMLVDLGARVVVIKSRGMELHRLPIADWRQTRGSPPSGVFRLRARPLVTRPKAGRADDAAVTAIELQHMPDRYDLEFDPGLILSVGPPLRARPWPWLTQYAYEWYRRVAEALLS